MEELCKTVISDLTHYGLCVIDDFLGYTKGYDILQEVLFMYENGMFKDGQVVSKNERDQRTIRSDLTTWSDGNDDSCKNIGFLINKIDNIINCCQSMENNGLFRRYNIYRRTKAMVACYPGDGAHYVKHIDNPNKDGRCVTAIYYLNLNWDVQRDGGMLQIFPSGTNVVANIEPKFDRMLFFWSDMRNPHQVQSSFRKRYSVAIWYFDWEEHIKSINSWLN